MLGYIWGDVKKIDDPADMDYFGMDLRTALQNICEKPLRRSSGPDV